MVTEVDRGEALDKTNINVEINGETPAMESKTKMEISNDMIREVVTELVSEEAVKFIEYLRGKTKISEFIIAEELEVEIHRTRHVLYKLLENNLATFIRKKDKIKGWYICYWDFNEGIIPYLHKKLKKEKAEKAKERLAREENNQFFMCRQAHVRMNFDQAIEFEFKCPECGEIMNQIDNSRTIEFLKERIKQLEAWTYLDAEY